MKSEVQEILVPDLNAEALEEIADLLGGDVRIEDASNPQEGGRDITTATAVVLVSLAALRVLAVWITRHTTSEETEVSIQTKRNDGSVKTISFRKRSSSAQSEAEVLKQLAAACHVDLSDVTGAEEKGD